jgi:hypothetical protein
MDKPNREQTMDNTRENYGVMVKEGHKPEVIRKLMMDMYIKVTNILKEGRTKAIAICTLQEINKVIDESVDEHNAKAGRNKC